jgi:hypothetical protein
MELENNVEAISRDLVGKEKWKISIKIQGGFENQDLGFDFRARRTNAKSERLPIGTRTGNLSHSKLDYFSPDMASRSYHPPIICMSVATTAALLQPRQARYISPSSFHYCLLTVISGAMELFSNLAHAVLREIAERKGGRHVNVEYSRTISYHFLQA